MNELKVGQQLTAVVWTVTQDKINRYSRYALGRDTPNIHTDREKATLAGLPGPVAHGRHPVAIVSESMVRDFGAAWVQGGELDMTLTRLIFPGDTLTLQREIVGVTGTADERLVTVKIAFVNQEGQPVQTGEARVRLPGHTATETRRRPT